MVDFRVFHINCQNFRIFIHLFIRSFVHSLPLFNLSLPGAFCVIHASRALENHDLPVEGIYFGSHTYFFDHTRTRGPPRMSDQLNAKATSETTRTLKTIHTIHSLEKPYLKFLNMSLKSLQKKSNVLPQNLIHMQEL